MLFSAPVKRRRQKEKTLFNYVNLIGYLGGDAEYRSTRNNPTFVVLSLANKGIKELIVAQKRSIAALG